MATYRNKKVNVLNYDYPYFVDENDAKYVRDWERDLYLSNLKRGGDMAYFVNGDSRVLGFGHWYGGKNDKLSYHEKFKPQPPLVIIPTPKRKKMKRSQSPPPKELKQTSTQINKAVAWIIDRTPGKRPDPPMPSTSLTGIQKHRYEKWLKCWHIVHNENEQKKAECKLGMRDDEFVPDDWPQWTPEWRKRRGYMWTFDIPQNLEMYENWKHREEAKEPYSLAAYEYDSDSDLSTLYTEYSDDASFDNSN